MWVESVQYNRREVQMDKLERLKGRLEEEEREKERKTHQY